MRDFFSNRYVRISLFSDDYGIVSVCFNDIRCIFRRIIIQIEICNDTYSGKKYKNCCMKKDMGLVDNPFEAQ